jgi:hypothetical protein
VLEDPQDQREWQKLLFDYYKHFTTLGGAAALVLLAIYREDVLPGKVVVAAAVCFTLSTLFSLFGLLMLLAAFPYLRYPAGYRVQLLPALSGSFFGAGVVIVLEHIARLPLKYVNITAGVLLVGCLAMLIVTYFKSRR